MDEAKVIEINKATALSGYSGEELREADQWVKQYALDKLAQFLGRSKGRKHTRDYVLLMARCHFGSVETDEYLRACNCYPAWLNTD